jgi:hypothetical protein
MDEKMAGETKFPAEKSDDFGENKPDASKRGIENNPFAADDLLETLDDSTLDEELKHITNREKRRRVWETGGSTATAPDASFNPTRWELDLFLHTLYNVNDNLRLQMTISGGLMAACIGMLNVMAPGHATKVVGFVNDVDRYVFIPALISIVISYVGLEHHWNYSRRKAKPPEQMEELYSMVAFKYKMLHMASVFLLISAALLGAFILIEFG